MYCTCFNFPYTLLVLSAISFFPSPYLNQLKDIIQLKFLILAINLRIDVPFSLFQVELAPSWAVFERPYQGSVGRLSNNSGLLDECDYGFEKWRAD
jgi:hypothetical protein